MADSEEGVKDSGEGVKDSGEGGVKDSGEGVKDSGEGVSKPCMFKKVGRRGGARKKRRHPSSGGMPHPLPATPTTSHTHYLPHPLPATPTTSHTHYQDRSPSYAYTLTHSHSLIDDSSDDESAVVRKDKKLVRGKLYQHTNTKSLYKPEGLQ